MSETIITGELTPKDMWRFLIEYLKCRIKKGKCIVCGGKCIVCDKMTKEKHEFCDSVDEEGQPEGKYFDYCHDLCFESLAEKL